MAAKVQCHYEVLGVDRDADVAAIKKSHRKLALKYHPDKNLGDEQAAETFRLVQQAYEVLSDPQERKWYDDHREAILAGWSTSNGPDSTVHILFNVIPFMHPGCYAGYHDKKGGYFRVYQEVFENIVACERKQTDVTVDLPTEFGNSDSDWETVRDFYQSWESFSSALNFAWEDNYNANEDAPNRRVRRLMEDDNRKARKAAKKEYNSDILQLVAFVKRRDPRVKVQMEEKERQKREQEAKQKQQMMDRKKEQQKAKEAWKEQARREMEQAEEEDRLAGRVRLADLEDDYDYGGGKKKKGKKKKSKQSEGCLKESDDGVLTVDLSQMDDEASSSETHNNQDLKARSELLKPDVDTINGPDQETLFEEDEDYPSIESESEPDVWRCECCRKDFKSEGQMENHMKSKKHKDAFKKHQANLGVKEELLFEMTDQLGAD